MPESIRLLNRAVALASTTLSKERVDQFTSPCLGLAMHQSAILSHRLKCVAFLTMQGSLSSKRFNSTEASAAWFEERLEKLRTNRVARPGFQLFLGETSPEMIKNQVLNLMERRIRTLTYVAKPRA